MRGRIHIGTSGWMYKSWRHSFYEGQPTRTWLHQIDEKLGSVEVDGTFYRQQKLETFEKWASQVSSEFRFAIRGHRYVTHNLKLLNVEESIRRVREPALGLGSKLSAVLWQLPPFLRKDTDRLKAFGEQLQLWSEVWHVLEFRHPSWFDEGTAKVLEEYKLVNCISDAGRFERWDAVTAGAVYVRLHGKPRTYADSYSPTALGGWAKKVRQWSEEGKEVFVFFDNDIEGAAPENARSLIELVGSPRSRVSLR
jgi:uncharacterized protein YecE (DUF72 family)